MEIHRACSDAPRNRPFPPERAWTEQIRSIWRFQPGFFPAGAQRLASQALNPSDEIPYPEPEQGTAIRPSREALHNPPPQSQQLAILWKTLFHTAFDPYPHAPLAQLEFLRETLLLHAALVPDPYAPPGQLGIL
jgi:hypothetical protein